MDSASSSSLLCSKVWRGLVVDSCIWSMAMYWNALLSCMVPSLWAVDGCGCGAHTLPCIRFRRRRNLG